MSYSCTSFRMGAIFSMSALKFIVTQPWIITLYWSILSQKLALTLQNVTLQQCNILFSYDLASNGWDVLFNEFKISVEEFLKHVIIRSYFSWLPNYSFFVRSVLSTPKPIYDVKSARYNRQFKSFVWSF